MERIKNLFEPKSIALVGASEREGAVGRILMSNLMLAKDARTILPVNPKKKKF